MMTSSQVRRHLVEALRLDLVGPPASDADHPLDTEILHGRDTPSRWYLTGFLVPIHAPEEQRFDPSSSDEIGGVEVGEAGHDNNESPDPAPSRKAYLASSIGLSVLVPPEATRLEVHVAWGEYDKVEITPEALAEIVARRQAAERAARGEAPEATAEPEPTEPTEPTDPTRDPAPGPDRADAHRVYVWRRRPQRPEPIVLALAAVPRHEVPVPGSRGLFILPVVKAVDGVDGVPGARVVSVYLVNRRDPALFGASDSAIAFQAELTLRLPADGAEQLGRPCFVARADVHTRASEDPDEKTADLQYRDVNELAVGHGVAAVAHLEGGGCREVRTAWVPESTVLRVEPRLLAEARVTWDPEVLATLTREDEVRVALGGLPDAYAAWIAGQRASAGAELAGERLAWAGVLMQRAEQARRRIAKGIDVVATDPQVRRAFALMNKVIARASRQRNAALKGLPVAQARTNHWRPFQLAFILLALDGVADATSVDRRTADLLFFPTGGGKTEAYLGLAALAMLLRRLRSPGQPERYRGTSVLMRYTLRLLTLDQLGRAAGLVCALELERQADPAHLGKEPFEVGLWVGSKATPNRMGTSKDKSPESTARYRVQRYKLGLGPLPVPLESCPWCGKPFDKDSFQLEGNQDAPSELVIRCRDLDCEPSFRDRLPIVAVDETIYERLPAFLIATVDKLASLPWMGDAGKVLGTLRPGDAPGSAKGKVPPPDLVIQDELHLISGPLGTIVGLYEAAIDALATERSGERSVRPKIIASTATVRRADRQVRGLFARGVTALFPPPGPDRRDSFFAEESTDPDTGRLYVGVAAQGRSGKVVLLRTYQALLSAAKRLWNEAERQRAGGGGASPPDNPVDPYMTLLGYFGALRELGGSRRIVEDEVHSNLQNRARRRRLNDPERRFADRYIDFEPVELTSRETTSKVAEAKARLGLAWTDRVTSDVKTAARRVDVALATNMISVGLDIPRLGLMVVLGQPKSSAEYIQATSRVGRQTDKPGLVVTLLSIHKPRDRSHYERFDHYHRTFYRAVEATSVTPFSKRALDRALPAVVIAMARHGAADLTDKDGAARIAAARAKPRPNLEDWIVDALVARAREHRLWDDSPEEHEEAASLEAEVRDRVRSILDGWQERAAEAGGNLRYQRHEGARRTRAPVRKAAAGKQGAAAAAAGAGAAGAGTGDEDTPAQAMLLRDMLAPEGWRFRAPWSMRDVEPEIPIWVRTLKDERPVEED